VASPHLEIAEEGAAHKTTMRPAPWARCWRRYCSLLGMGAACPAHGSMDKTPLNPVMPVETSGNIQFDAQNVIYRLRAKASDLAFVTAHAGCGGLKNESDVRARRGIFFCGRRCPQCHGHEEGEGLYQLPPMTALATCDRTHTDIHTSIPCSSPPRRASFRSIVCPFSARPKQT